MRRGEQQQRDRAGKMQQDDRAAHRAAPAKRRWRRGGARGDGSNVRIMGIKRPAIVLAG